MTGGEPEPGLRYRIGFACEENLLRAHVTGTNDSVETTLAYWLDIAREVRRVSPATLLVVDEMDGPTPPPEEPLQFVQALRGQGFEGVRVAFVEANLALIPGVEHAEIFARELGFDAHVFANETVARIWLRHGEA